jgi:cell division protein FtsQ
MGFVNKERTGLYCSKVNIIIDKPHTFINKETVENLLIKNDIILDSNLIENINFDAIEKLIETNPAVKTADIYNNFLGEVFIDIKQRNPVMRIVTEDNDHYYVDDNQELMPVSHNYAASVPVVSGHIDNRFVYCIGNTDTVQNNILNYPFAPKDLYDFVLYLNHNSLWKYQIEQIYITENKEIELVPRVGNHIIILGDLKDYEYKLNKLVSLYKNGFSNNDWNIYSSINLKYSDQVICKKR